MTFAELRALVDRMSFAPGQDLVVEHDPKLRLFRFVLTTNCPDSENPARIVTVGTLRPAMEFEVREWDDDCAARHVYIMLRDQALHEVNEWYKIGEKHFIPPHPDNPVVVQLGCETCGRMKGHNATCYVVRCGLGSGIGVLLGLAGIGVVSLLR